MTAPEGYDPDRRNRTFGSVHKPDKEARQAADKRHDQKVANRMPGHFGKANWDAYQHFELYNMIMKADAGQMYDRAQQWKKLADHIEDTTSRVQGVVEQVMTSWQGQAAVNAGSSTTRLMQWAGTASHTAATVASNLSTYSDTVATAQRHMPPPAYSTAERNFRDGYSVMTSGGPADAVMLKQLTTDGMVSTAQAHARKAEAVTVMEHYEAQSKSVHDEMPHFTDAQQLPRNTPERTPAAPPPGAGGGSGSGAGSGAGAVPPAGSGGGVSSPSGNGSTSPSGFVDPSFGPGGLGPGGNGLQQGPTSFGGPGSLNGSGADAFRSGPGFGAGFGGAVPGAVPGMGVGGGAGGGAGAGAASRMGPGGLFGRGPGGAGVGSGGVLGAGGTGARGGAGAMGGMPFGQGANGEEDGEHTNKYDEGLDLFDDLPPAYPPVFGA